jgi:hypothetical protein
MEAGRSEIIGHIGYGSRGVCHNHATGDRHAVMFISPPA